MITRHFEHPNGATAALEMPAGWSRNCWYELRIHNPHAATAAARDSSDRKTFQTPDEARAGAVARERLALANGWKPRMAAIPPQNNLRASIHKPSGERINAEVLSVNIRTIENSRDYEPRYKKTRIVLSQEQRADLSVVDGGHSEFQPGDRFILRQDEHKSSVVMACIVDDLDRNGSKCRIQARVVSLEEGESEATNPDRQAIIQAGVETDTSLVELWDWLGTRIQATTERQQVQAAIIRGRAERQARLQREQELREMRERTQAEQEAQHTREMLRRQIESLQSRPMSRAQQTDEALRRLSGGVDLNKPKKRKIDLGE